MSKSIWLFVFMCFSNIVCAQTLTKTTPLVVGDTIPAWTFNNTVNIKSKTINIAKFQNKLIILDFWATWCGSCISAFAEDTKLQKLYKDSIQFLLVNSKSTRDTRKKISLFFSSYRQSYSILPSFVEDTILDKWFPHHSIPYLVWIKNNRVLAITQDPNLVIENIRSYENQKELTSSKFDEIPYESTQPIFVNGNGGEAPHELFRSQLIPYKPGIRVSSSFFHDSSQEVNGLQFVSQTRFDLISAAYPELSAFDFNRVIFKVQNLDGFSLDSVSENWNRLNRFTYSASFPPTTLAKARRYMRDDLDKYFNIKIDSVFIVSTCYVLRSGKQKVPSTFDQNIISEKNTKNQGFLREFTVSEVVNDLNQKSKIPYLDETNPYSKIWLTRNHQDITNEELIAMLKRNGIIVISLKKELKYLVISDQLSAN